MKLASLIAGVVGLICIVAGHLLLPTARRADSHQMPDGTLAVFSPDAGLWVIKWGWIVGLSFLVMAAILFVLSRAGKRYDHDA